ncbi:SprT family zinc-dependent metalloprotease [Methylophaga sp.]|uniref:M48 family metallopeptidase n=1 Tax=Methylophaga sp. TaxID=2024840 RepID=UPI0013FFD58E|nr:SprT family zinc-dependent metalloprotease [Methylophaga sp.]MTI64204.1 M48 family metallopeptidase [Methylophaga sp.]
MKSIHCNGVEVEVIRSKRRKTLSLAIRDGEVQLRIPARLPMQQAEYFVQQKSGWIQQKLAAHPPVAPKQFVNGERLLYLGIPYQLAVYPSQPGRKVTLIDKRFCVEHRGRQASEVALKKQITDWYKQQAQSWLAERCELLARQTGFKPGTIEVKTYRARWGSCTLSGKIQLNWKLIMAPAKIIDYVIIHELCHLRQHNHSPAFWRLVEQFDPDFTQHRAWLKINGQQLQL